MLRAYKSTVLPSGGQEKKFNNTGHSMSKSLSMQIKNLYADYFDTQYTLRARYNHVCYNDCL